MKRRSNNFLVHVGGIIFLLFLVSGCAAPTAQKQARPACEDLPAGLNYYDSDTFDSKLSRTLACRVDAVELTLPAPESTSKIPERLDNWLAAVDSSGGDVIIDKDPARVSEFGAKGFDGGFIVGIIFDIVEVAKIAYQEMEDRRLYGPAENYNVLMYYEDGTGVITRIIFKKR